MYRKITLDNGLRLITANLPHTRSVSLAFFIGTGSRYETESQSGVSHFIEHLCFRGTPQRPTPYDISTAIEGIGGLINAGTDKELTMYWCKVAQHHFPIALDVLSDMLLNSKFDAPDIEKERQVIIEEINMGYDSPPQEASMLIDELLWPGHPLGRDIAGTRESMQGINRDMMLSYIAAQYQPRNTVVAIAGNIDQKEVAKSIESKLGAWQNGPDLIRFLPADKQQAPRLKVEYRETEQIQLCLAVPGCSMADRKRYPLDMLSVVLGDGMSSRLFSEIRDKLGLAYSIASYADHFLDTGSMIVSAGVDSSKLNDTIAAVIKELYRIKSDISADEMTKAKEYAKGRLLLRMEDSHSVAGWAGGQEILTNRIQSIDNVMKIIDSMKIEDLQQMAERLFRQEELRLAVVGPVKDEKALRQMIGI